MRRRPRGRRTRRSWTGRELQDETATTGQAYEAQLDSELQDETATTGQAYEAQLDSELQDETATTGQAYEAQLDSELQDETATTGQAYEAQLDSELQDETATTGQAYEAQLDSELQDETATTGQAYEAQLDSELQDETATTGQAYEAQLDSELQDETATTGQAYEAQLDSELQDETATTGQAYEAQLDSELQDETATTGQAYEAQLDSELQDETATTGQAYEAQLDSELQDETATTGQAYEAQLDSELQDETATTGQAYEAQLDSELQDETATTGQAYEAQLDSELQDETATTGQAYEAQLDSELQDAAFVATQRQDANLEVEQQLPTSPELPPGGFSEPQMPVSSKDLESAEGQLSGMQVTSIGAPTGELAGLTDAEINDFVNGMEGQVNPLGEPVSFVQYEDASEAKDLLRAEAQQLSAQAEELRAAGDLAGAAELESQISPLARALTEGRPVEAMHVLPQSVGEGIPGYSGEEALTYLEEKPIHRMADKDWIDEFKDLAEADETTSAADVQKTIAESFAGSPQSPGVQQSLSLRLQDEMAELGIGPADEIRPYRPRVQSELPPGVEELDFDKPPSPSESIEDEFEEIELPSGAVSEVEDAMNDWIDQKYGKK
ncbi:MAG: hypothetical protein P0119_09905 [Nitrospira sp.]|nr:hypothetical protein [Nitrospira sp.]